MRYIITSLHRVIESIPESRFSIHVADMVSSRV
jgi:hypothetical protein